LFDHVTIRVSDREASEDFYDTVLATIGIEKANSEDWIAEWGVFSISPANDEKPATRGLHIGFAAPSRAHVDEFWRIGVEAGYRSDGEPGLRPEYGDDYYGSFLLDPDGNSAEAVHHDNLPSNSEIDHLWIRVSDLQASHSFYETLTPWTRFSVDAVHPDRVKFDGEGDVSFSVVAGEPTENLHMAFPANVSSTAEALHLDPDGNEIELRPPG
jgi:catechol 2,3-dioxygenase-like lactoylglutathione lyase family enzyme